MLYIRKSYNIPIIIDSVIIPIDYSFQAWDFLTNNFKNDKLEILLPIINSYLKDNYFTKCNDEWLAINLHFIIKVPWKNRKTKAIIRSTASRDQRQYIRFEKDKEIDIDEEITNIEYKLEINCENITDNSIGICECEIDGQIKRIDIKTKKCQSELNYNFDFQKIEVL